MYHFPEEMRRTLEALSSAMAYYRQQDGKIFPLLVTDGLCRLMHLDRESLIRMFETAMFEYVHPDDAAMVCHAATRFARGECDYNMLYRACYDDSETYRFFHTTGYWQTMEDGTRLAVLVYADISAAMDENQNLLSQFIMTRHDRFYTDPVTKMHNGNYLHEFAEEKLHRYLHSGQQPAFVYINIDSMRSYNNQYGVAEGDSLLSLVAQTLRSCFPDALIVRLVDDKFVVLTDHPGDALLSERLHAADQTIRAAAVGNTIGIRAGICLYEKDMQISDALDHAKHALRQIGSDLNIICSFYSRDTEEQYWEERYIIERFDQAMEEGWIRIYYQALMRTWTGKIAAHEALARWEDPEKGVISPAVFVPILEKHHLLYKLDLYMVEQVCREIPQRHAGNLPLVPVSVNFAAQDFDHVDLPDEMNRIIDRYDIGRFGLTRHDFIVEITEQDLAEASDRFLRQLRRLRDCGYRIWIDDFGSGYSSLSVFSQFEFDLVKFDLELLRHLDDHDGANRIIMRTIVDMCNQLGVLTLAEGVEQQEQMDFLKEIGCELSQGFHLYRPESLPSILQRLANGDLMMPCETPEERLHWLQGWNLRRRLKRHDIEAP